VAEDLTQDAAEDVLGAAEDGSSSVSGGKAITTPAACPNCPPTPRPQGFFINGFFIAMPSTLWTFERPSDSGGRVAKGRHVKDAANAAFQGAKKGMLRRAATRTRAPPTPALR